MKTSHLLLIFAVVLAVSAVCYQLGLSHATQQAAVPAPTPALATELPAPMTAVSQPKWKSAKESRLHWEERVAAVREMPRDVTNSDVAELLAFLHSPPAGSKNDWYVVCNEIMVVLRKRALVSKTYSAEMLRLLQDAAADPVIRDYAAQSLAQWIAGLDPATGHETDPVKAEATFDAMLAEVTKQSNSELSLTGTALNALADAALNGADNIRDKSAPLAAAALAIAQGSKPASTANRSAAIQVCARLGVSGIRELCRKLVADESAHADVRLSAIAALGLAGNSADQPLLTHTARDYRFQYAATAALQRLTQP